MSARELITDHLDLWTSAVTTRSTAGRGRNGKIELTGIKKLRELILELAVRGKLVDQDPSDEPASVLLERIAQEKARLVKEGKIKKPKKLPEIAEEEKPFELPDGWAWKRIGSIGFTQTGSTPSKSNLEFFGKDIPFIKPADITDSGIRHDNEGLSTKGLEELGKWAENGSILMVCIGTIGKCGMLAKRACFNQQINSITFSDNQISKFALLCLKSPYFQSLAWEKSSSTTISILNKGKWSTIPIPVPSIDEQHRIVDKVDELMALCDRLEQQVGDQLEAHEVLVDTLLDALTRSADAAEMAESWARIAEHFDTLFTTETSIDKLKQTILQLAVMGRLVRQNAEEEPVSTLIERIKEEKSSLSAEGNLKRIKQLPPIREPERPYQIPDHWEWVRLGTIAEAHTGNAFKSQEYTSEGVFVLRVTNINKDGTIDATDAKYISQKMANCEHRRFQLSEGDILLVMVGGSLGKIGIVGSNILPAVLNQNMWKLQIFGGIPIDYFVYGLKQINANQIAITSSTHGHLAQGVYLSKLFPLPPIQEQHRIVDKVDELMALCDQLKARLSEAGETRTHLAEAVVEQAVS